MNRLVVLTLVLALALCVPASRLLADGPAQTQTQTQAQTQTQTQAQTGDCDGECYQNQSGNAHQGDLADPFQYLFQLMLKFFGGGE